MNLHLLMMICPGRTWANNTYVISENLKHKRSELNKLCHVEKVPGQIPGAQISFSQTLKDNIRSH